MAKKRDVVRFQVEMSRAQMDELEALMHVVEVTTKKDLLNNALTILKWAVREKANGSAIFSVNKRSDVPNRELLMPFLESVVEKREGHGGTSSLEVLGSFDDRLPPAVGRAPNAPSKPGYDAYQRQQTDATEDSSSPNEAPAQAGRGQRRTLTPFERWLKQQKRDGMRTEGSSATWRDFVAQTKRVSPKPDLTEDDVSSDKA
jgi:hypothetical protein